MALYIWKMGTDSFYDGRMFNPNIPLLDSPRPLCNVDGVLDVEEVLGDLLAKPLPLDLPATHPAVKMRPGCFCLVPARVRLELSGIGEAGLAGKAGVENRRWSLPHLGSILLWTWWSWLG